MVYPAHYRYTKQHEWIEVRENIATIGITDHAQRELGDVVFVELANPGTKLSQRGSFGTVESVKAVSEVFSPVSGEILELNPILKNTPETINSDPHGQAWLIRLRLSNADELDELMDAGSYEAFISNEHRDS